MPDPPPTPHLDAIETYARDQIGKSVRLPPYRPTETLALVAAVRQAETRAARLEAALDETQAALRTVSERVIDRREFPAVVAKADEICGRALALLGEGATPE